MNRRRVAPLIVLLVGLSFLAAYLIQARETNAQGADAQENTGGNAFRQSSKASNPDALPEDEVPFVVITVLALAIIPVILGIKAAKRKGISPHWMWLGIYPVVGGWIGYWIISRKPAQRGSTTPRRSHEKANACVPLPSRVAASGSEMDRESLLDLLERAKAIEALVIKAKENQRKVPTSKERPKNRGDRQDDLSQAMTYWMNRMSSISPQKDPYVLYSFDTEQDAREGLLELPCIREGEGQKLICTEYLVFGHYRQTSGEYEAIIAGEALTHELWEQAKTSFEKHGGRRKNDLEPEDRTLPASPAENVSPGAVEFVREERKPSPLGSATSVYRIHKGPNAASARAFLEDNPVTKEFYYLVVETPEGNFGCDIQGIYEEPGSKEVSAICGHINTLSAHKDSGSQQERQSEATRLLREIMNAVPVTVEDEESQKKRIDNLISLGPEVIPNIESAIQDGANYARNVHAYENAGQLCEAIAKIGGPRAHIVLTKIAIQESSIAEFHRYIRSGAKKGLAYLENGAAEALSKTEKTRQASEPAKPLTRTSIPGLLDIGTAQANAGECLAAVESYIQAVEIEPEFMMASSAWKHISSVFTGKDAPGRGKNWICVPKELIPDDVLKHLDRLPNYSTLPDYHGPYVQPPTKAEILNLIADLRKILIRFKESVSGSRPG